jgi:uncharacterized protein with ParB-like and HNH nuclease domain
MKLRAISAKKAVTEIKKGNLFLPPIQRNFVWKEDRIIDLFDSLYRNYPIGNCIFWKLKPETSRSYPLYKFVTEYTDNKRSPINNEHAPTNLLDDVYAVVDGQQRLSSLFIGLAGIYNYKKSGKGKKNVAANFVQSRLFVNLLGTDNIEFEGRFFDFLSKEDSAILNERNCWFEVGLVLKWKNAGIAESYVNEALQQKVMGSKKKSLINKFESRKGEITSILKNLYAMITENRLYYFDIDSQDLDEVVNIFTRVNSGGMTLSPSDLLFSVLISQWNEGRDKINNLVLSLNQKGVTVSKDFVMRACLVLADHPVKYNLKSFNKSKVQKIRNKWDDIELSLLKLGDLLPEIGYMDLPNLSENSLIPIAYYIIGGGSTKTPAIKANLQKYYIVSQINGVFGGSSDQVLEKVRAEIKRQRDNGSTFNFRELSEISLPGRKSLKLTVEDLDELVSNTDYFSPHAYFILSLIYPMADFKIPTYDVDHIHPRSKFNRSNLINNGVIDETVIDDWILNKRDLLPNLQLLLPDPNRTVKRSLTIVEFLKTKLSGNNRKRFMKDNLLPTDLSLLNLNRFDEFFDYRKKQLVGRLRRNLGIQQ